LTDAPENLSLWPAPPEGSCGLGESLETEVAIFGAGIHGSALSRELTLRGVPCALVDRGAIGGGTSQWSSQLLHGGIRYMLTGDVKQMREGLHERATWARLAPWRCQWQAFWMPHRSLLEGLAHRFGIGLYDHWGSDRPGWPEGLRLGAVPRSIFREDPRARETPFRGATAYADLLTWDRDLVRDLAASGAAQRLDFHEVGDFEAQRGNLVKVRLTDRRDGRSRELSFRTAVFALGPWHDQAMRAWFGDTLLKLRLSAGIHLWFDAMPGCERPWALRRPGGRILFVIPRDGRLMVGTTEREVSMAEGGFTEITHSEREEIFEALRTYIPGIPWRELPVRAEEVGVRPLVRPAKRRSGTSGLSREALLDPHPRFPNAWMVLGGKLTTARALMDRLATQITGQACEASRTTPLKKWDGL
jgi:glycerol-3-phosphate dehydrogenase